MKTINIKKGTVQNMVNIDITDRQPCWYVDLNNAAERDKATWVVGVKAYQGDDAPDEYSLKLADIGNVNDDDFWSNVTSVDFALRLLSEYRADSVKQWVAGGCK